MKKVEWILSLACVFSILLVSFANAELRINEVMHHTNNSLGNEWVELYNDGGAVILLNWKIGDTSESDNISINISANGYALIVDDIDCASLIVPSESCISLNEIGNQLGDSGDTLYLYNNESALISNFSWTSSIKSTGKSYGYNGSAWMNCTPTPGAANNCTISGGTCTAVNNSCGNWADCSGTSKSRTCTNTSASCANTTWTETQSCSSNSGLYIEVNWNNEEIINGKEFDIEVNGYNLGDYDYDVRVWLEFEENSTIISERYDANASEWSSGIYYADKFLSGDGNKSRNIKVRINTNYENFYGDAKILAKIRKHGDRC